MCVAPTRAEAEDIAAAIVLDLEELPAVHDMLAAREPGSALVHEHWGDNVYLETLVDVDIASALDAPIKVSRTISTGRQCMAPIEGRGTVVQLYHRLDQLVVACIVCRDGTSATEGEIQAFLRERVAAYKVPKRVLFFADGEVPMTSSATKVRDDALLELVQQRLAATGPTTTATTAPGAR